MFSSTLDGRHNLEIAEKAATKGDHIPSSVSALTAVSFARKMRGGSQSSLIRASDGKLYVVKFSGSPQGPNVLANEALGSLLAGHLGLPVAASREIYVSDEFLDSNPETWFELHTGRNRPKAGLHYASELVQGEGNASVYEILPRSWFSRIENRGDFLGMLLLDIWCNNTDNRQAIFVESVVDRSLKAVFIDHGHMFGGPTDNKSEARPGTAQFLDCCIYDGLFSELEIAAWMQKIWSVTAEVAYTFTSAIPVAWSSSPLGNIIAKLLSRRHVLIALISQQEVILQERGIGYQKRNIAVEQPMRVHSDRVCQQRGSWRQISLSAA